MMEGPDRSEILALRHAILEFFTLYDAMYRAVASGQQISQATADHLSILRTKAVFLAMADTGVQHSVKN